MMKRSPAAATKRFLRWGVAIPLAILGSPASAQMAERPVPIGELEAKCGLDPDIMAGIERYFLPTRPFVVFRNGNYCWRSGGASAISHLTPIEVFSSTKTYGAILVGAVSARSSMRDTSRLTDWLSPAELARLAPRVNRNATVAHVLSMTGHSANLSHGMKSAWSYDATGVREINVLIPLMDRVIEREPARFEGARTIKEFSAILLRKLGMTRTNWPGFTIGSSMYSTSADLARLGELVLRKGMWNGEKILDEQYTYRMTHAAFEDSSTSYGYLTYVNADANNAGRSRDSKCSPYARWARYPHAPFYEASNSNGGYPFADPAQDIGVAWSQGMNSSTFTVHRGLDMVIGSSISVNGMVTRLVDVEGTSQNWIWDNIRPALVANLPQFAGDEAAFCAAYRAGLWSQARSPWSAEASL